MAFEISLKGKVALVTGGAKGIGAEICRQMAIAGADIVINHHHIDSDRMAAGNLEQELTGYGIEVLKCEADVSKEPEVKEMMGNIVGKFGQIDILVNNAAILMPSKFEEMSYEKWKAVLDVNLNGVFLVTRYTIPYMLDHNQGSIIMISSGTTINGGGGGVNYPASKAGVEGMAKQLAKECAPRGIRVNVIQPAVIDTELLRQRYPTDGEIKEYGKRIPLGRVGKPFDIAYATVFLASDRASYITGACLLVDGGRTYFGN